jgi:hypothetical protein
MLFVPHEEENTTLMNTFIWLILTFPLKCERRGRIYWVSQRALSWGHRNPHSLSKVALIKNFHTNWAGVIAQCSYLPSTHKALDSIPRTETKQNKAKLNFYTNHISNNMRHCTLKAKGKITQFSGKNDISFQATMISLFWPLCVR